MRVVIGKGLNRAERNITAVYDRHSYDSEKRATLEAWARKLQAILENKPQPRAVGVPIGGGGV